MFINCDWALPPKENPLPEGGCSVSLEEMVTEEELMNGCEKSSVEEKEIEKDEEMEGWYPVLGRELEGGDVWDLFVVIGVTVEENIVGITEVVKPVEMGCGDGEEPSKVLLCWINKKNDGAVVLASVLLTDTVVIFGLVDVVASVWSASHGIHI